MIKIVPLTNSKFDSGGQSYTAGDGISISGGVVAATSTLLQDAPQIISSGYIARTSNGTGIFLSGATVRILNSGKAHYSATLNVATLYGATVDTSLQLGSMYVSVKHSSDANHERIVHAGMSATPDEPGIVQPDNSTCTVASGGILSVTPPTTLWASGNAGSEVTYSALDGASVLRAYKNGLLMESGADYVIGSSGIVSYTTPLESSDRAAFEYYPAAPTRNIVPDGGKALKSAEPMEDILDEQGENTEGEER